MPKEFRDKLSGILDWWNIGDFTDRQVMEKELTSLLDDAYFRGWSDAKDDSLEEEGIQNGEWTED